MKDSVIKKMYEAAQERFAAHGVDTEKAIETLGKISFSLHCWQTDDVSGFENQGGELTGGIQVTGNYPGRARTGDELRDDAQFAFTLIPGKKRFNLHTLYVETVQGRKDWIYFLSRKNVKKKLISLQSLFLNNGVNFQLIIN